MNFCFSVGTTAEEAAGSPLQECTTRYCCTILPSLRKVCLHQENDVKYFTNFAKYICVWCHLLQGSLWIFVRSIHFLVNKCHLIDTHLPSAHNQRHSWRGCVVQLPWATESKGQQNVYFKGWGEKNPEFNNSQILSKIATHSITNCDFLEVHNLCYGQPL